MMKALIGKQENLPDHIKQEILDAPETPMKNKEDRIRGRKGGRTASVTNRLNEGNIKGARLARRTSAASSKSKKDRLQRKVDAQDSKFFKDKVKRSRAK